MRSLRHRLLRPTATTASSDAIGSPSAVAVPDVMVPEPTMLTAPNPLRTPAPGRILLVGSSLRALGTAVAATDEDGLHGEDRHGPRRLDAVVIGDDVTPARDAALCTAADRASIPVVRPGRRPIIDVRAVNPIGWRRTTSPSIGVLLAHPDRARAWAAIDRLLAAVGGARLVALVPDPWPLVERSGLTVRRLPTDPAQRALLIGDLRAVVDDAGLHQGVAQRAGWIVEVAARGTPVIAADLAGAAADHGGFAADLAGFVASPLLTAIAATDLTAVDDPYRREAVSIRQRRAALRNHGAPSVWRTLAADAGLTVPRAPTVSILLATMRPDRVEAAVDRASRQRYPRVELVVALHGDSFPLRTEASLRARTGLPMEILRVPRDRTLGEVLNRATDAASGELVTKMDDDDLYGPDHLDDLTDALRYSDATIVGKGSEFVYLEELDTTLRRSPHGAETTNRDIAGGTLMLGREDLRQLGSWQPSPRAVDQRLIDDVVRAGGRPHRTHGHGFLLCRRATGHTWDPPVDYFLEQAVAQWRGLALDVAGVA